MSIKQLIDQADLKIDKAYKFAVTYFEPLKQQYHTVANERICVRKCFIPLFNKYDILKVERPLELHISRNGADNIYVYIVFEFGKWVGCYDGGSYWEKKEPVVSASCSIPIDSIYDENSEVMVKFIGQIMSAGKDYAI